jgi:hypothetical protein
MYTYSDLWISSSLIFVSRCFNEKTEEVFMCVVWDTLLFHVIKFYSEPKDQRDLKICTVCSKTHD